MSKLNHNDKAVLELINSYTDMEFKLTNFEISLRLKLTVGQVTGALSKLQGLNLITKTTIRTYNDFWITKRIINTTTNEYV